MQNKLPALHTGALPLTPTLVCKPKWLKGGGWGCGPGSLTPAPTRVTVSVVFLCELAFYRTIAQTGNDRTINFLS